MKLRPVLVEWNAGPGPADRRANVTRMRGMYFWSVGWGLKNGHCGWRRSFAAAERIAVRFMLLGKAPGK